MEEVFNIHLKNGVDNFNSVGVADTVLLQEKLGIIGIFIGTIENPLVLV